MKRKFISALLFGALVTASTSTFVSCKDYDDDITELRGQITTNATDLSSLVDEKLGNAENEIAALKEQASSLDEAYKKADQALNDAIMNATNDAQGYAEIQAQQAQTAAIDAARQLVEEASAKLQEALDKANSIIDEQGKTVEALLKADEELQNGIDAATSRANDAYTLAEQASKSAAEASQAAKDAADKAAEVADDLQTINETLSSQLNVIEGSLKEVKETAEDAASRITAQENALDALEKSNSEALEALGAEDDALRQLIETNQKEIEDLRKELEPLKTAADEALASAKEYTDKKVEEALGGISSVGTAIEDLKKEYAAADELIKDDVNSLKTTVEGIEDDLKVVNVKLANINSLLNFNVNNLITGIIYQDATEYNVFAKVGTAGAVFAKDDAEKKTAIFPYEGYSGYAKLTVGHYNIQEYAGEIYATVNPTDIDASTAVINLENSLGDRNTIYSLGVAKPAEGHLIETRATTSKNGLWKLPVNSITSSTDDPTKRVEAKALYALTTNYEQDTLDAEGNIVKIQKKIYSHYAINKVPQAATAASSIDMDVIGHGDNLDNNPAHGIDIQFSALNGELRLSTNGKRVYKKFVECVSVVNSEGKPLADGVKTFNEANSQLYTILAANDYGKEDTINVTCPESYKNYTVTLRYYIWNYNGSVSAIDKKLVFNQTLWGQDNTSLTMAPTGSTTQAVYSDDFGKFAFVNGEKSSNGTTWSQEAYYVEATVGNDDADIKGAVINLNSADKGTNYEAVTVGDARRALNTSTLDKIKQLQLSYDPSTLELDHEYNITLTFFDRNGFKVNIVNISFTMTVPTGKPSPWHIEAAFDTEDKLTIAWATPDKNDATNTTGWYDLSGSFYQIDNGFPTAGDPYSFKLNDSESYAPGEANHKFLPTQMPAASNYVMYVPNAAINQKANEEHTYTMTGGIMFYGLPNLISYNGEGGFADEFQIKFLSPIRYAILGTKDYIPGKTYEGMQNDEISVDYRQSVTINNSYFDALDPKEATATRVNFFENRDARIANTSIEFAKADDSNNALFKEIRSNGDGTYTLVTDDKVSMVKDTDVDFKLTVTDVWGAVTEYTFTVTVKANM